MHNLSDPSFLERAKRFAHQLVSFQPMRATHFLIAFLFIVAIFLQVLPPQQEVSGDVAGGFSEYFVPGAADDIQSILVDLSTSYVSTAYLTNVITMTATSPNFTVYYDHWENGYQVGANGDEVFTGFVVGDVLTFKSTQIPNPRGSSINGCPNSTNPNGITSNCYDGKDRIYIVGGATSISQVYWPTEVGTVYANAWELYPVKPWETGYHIPVGEDLYENNSTEYADFDCVYLLVTAWYDDTTVTFDNARTSAPSSDACGVNWWQDGQVVIDKGGTYFRGGIYSGSSVESDHPIEVQMIVGRENSSYDSRSHTLVPTGEWKNEYFSPVTSYGTQRTPSINNPSSNGLRLVKTPTESNFTSIGDVIHYTYVVTNTSYSNNTLLGPVTINDNKTTNESCPSVTTIGDRDNYLDRNESITCTSSYTITAADITAGQVQNSATASVGSATSRTSTVTIYDSTYTVTTGVNLYIFNPTESNLAVTYQDTTGSVVCNISAGRTISSLDCAGRYVPVGSGVRLFADENFYAIGEYDSGNAARNWGFSIMPVSSLGDEYFVPWAPGDYNVPPQNNGSPLFLTPTVDDQVIHVDFSPCDGVPDASITIDLLRVEKIRDADNDNTGMHLWSDYPFALTWGEDAQYSNTGNPYIDAGYTIPPPKSTWIDVIIDVDKSANPELIALLPGQQVEFTIDVSSDLIDLDNIYIQDLMPPYFEYVSGRTSITWPGGSYTANPTISGSASTGYTLRWGSEPENIGDLAAAETMTLSFDAVTVTGFSASTSVNNAQGTGYFGSVPITSTAQATVFAGTPGYIVVIKDAQPDSPQDFSFALVNLNNPHDPTIFSLDDDNDPSLPSEHTFGVRPGDYSIRETAVNGWDQTSATCISSIISKTPTIGSIYLEAGETVTCTFVNTATVDLAVTKSDGDYSIVPYPSINDPYKYTITVTYPGSGAVAYDVEVVDTLDPYLDYLSGSEPGYPYTVSINGTSVSRDCTWVDDDADGLGGTLTCSLGELSPGNTAVIEFWVKAVDGVPLYGMIETGECSQSDTDPADVCNLVDVTTTSLDIDLANNHDSEPKDIGKPTSVELVWFDVTKNGRAGITLGWETVNELDVLGFNIYRAGRADSEKMKLIAKNIGAELPGNLFGAVYVYKDKAVKPDKIYYYWLETIDQDGSIELYGPVKGYLKR